MTGSRCEDTETAESRSERNSTYLMRLVRFFTIIEYSLFGFRNSLCYGGGGECGLGSQHDR